MRGEVVSIVERLAALPGLLSTVDVVHEHLLPRLINLPHRVADVLGDVGALGNLLCFMKSLVSIRNTLLD